MVSESEQLSTEQQYSLLDAQRMHFRPVTPNTPDWLIINQGNTLMLRTDYGIRLKASTRHADKRTVLRVNSMIVANIINRDNVITYVPVKNGTESSEKITISCINEGVALLKFPSGQMQLTFDNADKSATSPKYHVTRLAKRRLSIEQTSPSSGNSCGGSNIEVPFTAVAALVFNTEELPLNARFGLACYLTSFKFRCEAPPIVI